MFEDYKKIPCCAELKDGKIQYYWYPKLENDDIAFDRALKRVEELLIKSIEGITSDKKIAIPLSGDIDSSLILAICRKLYPDKKIYTYSTGFYGEDEFEYSRLVAKKNNSIHKEKVLYKEDFIGENSLLKPLIEQKCEPLHPNKIALANIYIKWRKVTDVI
ncbi:MAG: asparagine synthase-related protein [Methanocellales archaeon]|nr:asparagine synthase-related protein [Methanocellales archaeon]MDD3291858.1 asparagine synthase-related protein [Methanocellales archaeon]MDD5235501.1 asparagine synthase-related protein [Methanocellales archaeon]MDD5485120.1 asparagine synthase-related protein [Methanocellales archaeon]